MSESDLAATPLRLICRNEQRPVGWLNCGNDITVGAAFWTGSPYVAEHRDVRE